MTKLELFGPMDQQYIWCKKSEAYNQKNAIPMAKYGGGPVLLSVCFAVRSEDVDCMKDIMDSSIM